MASLRISLINEAMQLAAAAGNTTDHGYHVPADVVARLHGRLRGTDEPAKTLQWAWRSQRARHDKTGWHRDGLAALYLLAALIDLQHAETAQPGWPQGDGRADNVSLQRMMAGAAHPS
jgi:hypothetical protein